MMYRCIDRYPYLYVGTYPPSLLLSSSSLITVEGQMLRRDRPIFGGGNQLLYTGAVPHAAGAPVQDDVRNLQQRPGGRPEQDPARHDGGCSFSNRSLTPRPSLKKTSYWKTRLAVRIPKKRRCCLGTKSKCQYDNEVHRQKWSWMKMPWFWYSKTAM